MRLYLDTEYNGFGGELISIALVPEDNDFTFYRVLPLPHNIDPWVQERVVPYLGTTPVSRETLRADLLDYLRLFGDVEIVADWSEDFVHFFNLFRGDTYLTSFDYSVRAKLLSGPSDIKPEVPHNALSDATALREWCKSKRKAA